jgi:hypothetical protein
MIMFNKRIMAALFAIAIASSLIVVSGFVGSAYAAKKVKQHEHDMNPAAVPFSGFPVVLDEDESSSRTSHNANPGDLAWTIRDANGVSAKEVNMWKEICNT